jgi:CubicO group peptidase (beta-lactamase class C family)
MNLSDYLTPRLWQAIGAQDHAYWNADRTGLEIGLASFNATLRDYARLGIVLANDGVRPDDATQKQIVPRDFLLEATDWKRVPEQFWPGRATRTYGYGYQFWLYPGEKRRFMMLVVFGQSVFIDRRNGSSSCRPQPTPRPRPATPRSPAKGMPSGAA